MNDMIQDWQARVEKIKVTMRHLTASLAELDKAKFSQPTPSPSWAEHRRGIEALLKYWAEQLEDAEDQLAAWRQYQEKAE